MDNSDKYRVDSVAAPPVGCRQCARLYEEVCELQRKQKEADEFGDELALPIGHVNRLIVANRMGKAIAAAVAAEREECAKIAESDGFVRFLYDDHIDNSDIARAIRARGEVS